MNYYREKIFENVFDPGSSKIEGLGFDGCDFVNCTLSRTKEIAKRSAVSNVEIVNSRTNGCSIGPAILEDVRVHNLATNDLLIFWGAIFDRVKLSGNIGKVKFNQQVHFTDQSEALQKPFDDFRLKFYANVDWALDISEAKFKDFDYRGIPARLIKRDRSTQVVVTRERALAPGWREKLSPTNTLWPFAIKLFLGDGDDDIVLAAPMGAPKAKRDSLLRDLEELRSLGVAEPD